MKSYRGECLTMYVEDVEKFLKVCESGVWFRHSDYPMNDNGAYFKIAKSSTCPPLESNMVCLECVPVLQSKKAKKEFALIEEKEKSKIYYEASLKTLICKEIGFWAENMTEKLTLGKGERFSTYLKQIPNEIFLSNGLFQRMESAFKKGIQERKEKGDEDPTLLWFLEEGGLNVMAGVLRDKQRETRNGRTCDK